MTHPESKPFSFSTNNSTNPHYAKNRAEKGGNEAMTRNAQSRSQEYFPAENKPKADRIGNGAKYVTGGTKVSNLDKS